MASGITLRTIAKAAGVTPTTVSLALRHHPRISAPTGERIRSLARSLGYRPNAEISRIMSRIREGAAETDSRPRIAWICSPDPDPAFAASLRRACADFGYQVDILPYTGHCGARICSILDTRGIRAALLLHPNAESICAGLHNSSFCLCAVSRRPLGAHRIDPAGAAPDWIAREAVELLDSLSRRHQFGRPANPKVIRMESPVYDPTPPPPPFHPAPAGLQPCCAPC